MVNRIDNWLSQRRRLTLLLLLLAAVSIRGVFFLQHAAGPAEIHHLAKDSDMLFFHEWASVVAEGDWLTDRSLHPYHDWHERVAEEFFDRHPDLLAVAGGDLDAASRQLWSEWYGEKRFHQSPLYPYLLATSYATLGPDPRPVIVAQMLLGIASILLLYLLTRRHFGDLAAVIAATLLLFYAPALFYEGILLRVTVIVSILLASALLLDTCLENPRRIWLVLFGTVLGIGMLAKSVFLVLTAGAIALILFRCRSHWADGSRRVLWVIVGIALALSPLVVRNHLVGVAPLSMSSVGPVSFTIANIAGNLFTQADGFTVVLAGTGEIMHQSGGHFLATVKAVIASHDSVVDFLSLQMDKMLALMHWYEVPNNVGFDYYKHQITVLKALPVRFVFIACLGVAGLLLALRRTDRHVTLYLLLATAAFSVVIVQAFSRYKVPLTIMLIPFAAFAVTRLVDWLADRRYVPAVAVLGSAIILGLFILRPLPANMTAVRPSDTRSGFSNYYHPMIVRAIRAGESELAETLIKRAFIGHPDIFPVIPPGTPAEQRVGMWRQTYDIIVELSQDESRTPEKTEKGSE